MQKITIWPQDNEEDIFIVIGGLPELRRYVFCNGGAIKPHTMAVGS